jgi:hypothetical protein
MVLACTLLAGAAGADEGTTPPAPDQGQAAQGQPAAPEAPKDPTRGQWDSFIDPFRDGEDWLADKQQKLQDMSKVRIGFGLSQGFNFNFNDPANGVNTLHSLDPFDTHRLNFDLAQLRINAPNQGWLPGFGLTLDAGTIAQRIKSDWNGNGHIGHPDPFENNNFDIEEAYLTYTIPDGEPFEKLTIKGGKFVTLLGAEVIEPWSNFNFSRSFLFGYAIPFTNTGGLLSYPFTDKLTVTAGAVEGWDNVDDNNRAPSAMGEVTYTVNDMVTLTANGIFGPEQTGTTGPKRGVADLVAQIKPTDKATFLLNYDYGFEQDVSTVSGSGTPSGIGTGHWQGFAGVINYNFTDRASAAFRGEWFADEQGVRTGNRQNLWETTITGKYLITQHLYGRVEYRHDESNQNHIFNAGPNFMLPGQDIVSIEVGYTFF